MCEVTIKNFNKLLPELEVIIKKSRFISLDTEFSCLHVIQPSLFDTGKERYRKLRDTVQQMIPVQIGLSAFLFDPDNNSYTAHNYTFYVFPRAFTFIDVKFLCQASSLQFLNAHKFDFNKLISEGISYLNRIQEGELLKKFNQFTMCDSSAYNDVENLLEDTTEIIQKWLSKAKDTETLTLKGVETYGNHFDIKYFLHKELRNRFKYKLWTFEDVDTFYVQKTDSQQYEVLAANCDLNKTYLGNLLGFTKIFRLLISLQKPIIGHNFLMDLMILIHNFEKPLPQNYLAFKKLVGSLFPNIYDTKCISFDVVSSIPEAKRWNQNSLGCLYEYFRDGKGRHLASNSPLIEPAFHGQETYHYSGWDAYCTGYIFIRMSHIFAARRFTHVQHKKFMSGELLLAVEKFRNTLNVIRGDISNINLSGDDPVSKRPPRLIIKDNKNKVIDINEVVSLMSTYGFVEVKSHGFKGNSAIVAVDNFGSARRILKHFESNSEFVVQQYNVIKHSVIAETITWTCLATSAVLLACYVYIKLN